MSNKGPGKWRRGTAYSVKFPTLPSLTVQPGRATLLQVQHQHDILTLQFSKESPKWFALIKTGVPVQFSWRQNNISRTWHGYVSYIVKNAVGQTDNMMEIRCIGVTLPLKERTTRVFTNSTISGAVQKIVTEFGFNFIGVDDDRVFEQLTIAGHSYWEWIQEQARRIGYGVVIHGMDFYFKPFDLLIEQTVSTVPVLAMFHSDAKINTFESDRTLDGIKVLNGEYIETGDGLRTVKNVSGVDPVTGLSVSASRSPVEAGGAVRSRQSGVYFSEVIQDQVVDSQIAATSAANGASQYGRFNVPAQIRGQGDPRIHPFGMVFVSGTGPNSDGFWWVKSVSHQFAWVGDYQTDIEAFSDGTGASSKSYARLEPTTAVGLVNLSEAVANGGRVPGPVSGPKVSLKNLHFSNVKEYTKDYGRWVSGSRG